MTEPLISVVMPARNAETFLNQSIASVINQTFTDFEPEMYAETCDELAERLRNVRSSDGTPLIRKVFQTADSLEAAQNQRLPDLVIHWADAVFMSTGIAGSQVRPEFVGQKYVGQHALEGFCIVPRETPNQGDEIRAEDLHSIITAAL